MPHSHCEQSDGGVDCTQVRLLKRLRPTEITHPLGLSGTCNETPKKKTFDQLCIFHILGITPDCPLPTDVVFLTATA